LFDGLSDDQLLALARSFRFENYDKRARLEELLRVAPSGASSGHGGP
jgi:hypothetical protein